MQLPARQTDSQDPISEQNIQNQAQQNNYNATTFSM
jgi:hypothetical protein